MTAVFDSLAVLGFRAKDQWTLIPLVDIIYDEAIKQIDALDQDVCKWNKYQEETKKMYMKLYADMGEFEMKMGFISHAHSYLDHSKKWHCKCFHYSFEFLIHKIKRLLLAKKRGEAWFNIKDIHWKHKKRYAEIIEQVRLILKSGRIPQPSRMNEGTKKWLGEYNPWIPIDQRVKEAKKDAEKARKK